MKIDKVGGQHDVWQVEIRRQFVDILFHYVSFHQSKRSVGVFHFYAKDQAQKETDSVFHKFPVFAIAAYCAVANHSVVLRAHVPESAELVGVSLAVGVGLEDVVRLVFNGVAL